MEDTETTFTCVFDPQLPSRLLKVSTRSCKLALCGLSTLMPPSTMSHDCPETVLGKTCTADCSYGTAAISKTAASTVLTCGSDKAFVGDLTPSYPTCVALACSIGELWLDGSSSGPDCPSWTIDENRAETYVEGCQAANETSGIWICEYEKVEGEVVLEVEILKCSSARSVVRPLSHQVVNLRVFLN